MVSSGMLLSTGTGWEGSEYRARWRARVAGAVPVLPESELQSRVSGIFEALETGSNSGVAAPGGQEAGDGVNSDGLLQAALAKACSPSTLAAIQRSAACVASLRACMLHLEDRVTAESDLASGAAQHDTDALGMPDGAAQLARDRGAGEAVAECWGVARPHWRRAVWEARTVSQLYWLVKVWE